MVFWCLYFGKHKTDSLEKFWVFVNMTKKVFWVFGILGVVVLVMFVFMSNMQMRKEKANPSLRLNSSERKTQ